MAYREGRVRPPRLVSVLLGRTWQPGQLLAWRAWPGACRFLVRVVQRRGNSQPPADWVDADKVRPRRGRETA